MLKIFDELEEKRKDTRLGIPREEGEALYSFIKEHNIKRVVETGICWGFTSAYILKALPKDGLLISLDLVQAPYIGSVVSEEHPACWKKCFGPSSETLKHLFLQSDDIDLFFHDSDHSFTNQMFEYDTAFPYVKFIGSHDIKLMGPPFAWEKFIAKTEAEILVKKGQLGIARVNL